VAASHNGFPTTSIFSNWNIKPYRNAWESLVQKMKVHKKDPHDEIKSSLNQMDSLQGHLFPKVWTVPTWASSEDLALAPHMAILPTQIHVQNTLNLSLNM
jgi:hypothetical protein